MTDKFPSTLTRKAGERIGEGTGDSLTSTALLPSFMHVGPLKSRRENKLNGINSRSKVEHTSRKLSAMTNFQNTLESLQRVMAFGISGAYKSTCLCVWVTRNQSQMFDCACIRLYVHVCVRIGVRMYVSAYSCASCFHSLCQDRRVVHPSVPMRINEPLFVRLLRKKSAASTPSIERRVCVYCCLVHMHMKCYTFCFIM